jgi:MOSC domain-containing protein YiiM
MKDHKLNILSINSGKAQPIAAKSGLSGIFKQPRQGEVTVSELGLSGDVIVDRENHGGVDQAVYVYCQRDYEWWRDNESISVRPGLFGENLTIEGMETADAHVGARLIGNNITLEITSHRTPCVTLGARMNDNTFPKRFLNTHRTGFYCRVIKEGSIKIGDQLTYKPLAGERVSISDLIKHAPYTNLDEQTLKRFLASPLHVKLRDLLARMLYNSSP